MVLFRSDSEPLENLPPVEDTPREISAEELDWRIGQMIMIGFRGIELSEEIEKAITEESVGGVVLFDYDTQTKTYERNIESREQVSSLIDGLQGLSEIPLFVAVDAEGGAVNRLKTSKGFVDIPSHKELASLSDSEILGHVGALAIQLKELGFNMNFAPVVDVNINPKNPIIGVLGRSFSSDPKEVSRLAKLFIEEQSRKGIISVVKHFPGHGSSTGDTHKGAVDVTGVYQDTELDPYRTLAGGGDIDAVMSAHVIDRSVDSVYPASLSEKHIQENLRSNIGFDGVVFSDDIDMRAIEDEFDLREIVILAINAGVDVIVSSNNVTGYRANRASDIKQAIMESVQSGDISEERIVESSERIMMLKKKYLDYNR